jgi:hypothetical protein
MNKMMVYSFVHEGLINKIHTFFREIYFLFLLKIEYVGAFRSLNISL